MKNITVTVDDATYRTARIRAAEMDTSVSALVRDYLRSLVENQGEVSSLTGQTTAETQAETRKKKLEKVIRKIRSSSPQFSTVDNLPRKSLYDHARSTLDPAVDLGRKDMDDDG
ncbi:MAG: hypothetical protein OXI60_04125 [Acidiferrobacterales bacterium]|nr:hypothetical protein [Acidiferrobacterales bacterium]